MKCSRYLTLVLLALASPGETAELKISTWNLNWFTLRHAPDIDLPQDVELRTPSDIAMLRDYAQKLAPDIIALQEVDGVAAVSSLFDPSRYEIAAIAENVVQRVAIAVRRPIHLVEVHDYAPLDVEAHAIYPLRDGLDATLALPGGTHLRVLAIHLKSGCRFDDLAASARPACHLLALQVPPLAAWVAARQAEHVPYLLLGDFNRVFDTPEAMSAALAHAAPLTRVTAGHDNPCWDSNPFIDHLFLGGEARAWLEAGSLRVQVFHESGQQWRHRLSDHCPVSITLRVPAS